MVHSVENCYTYIQWSLFPNLKGLKKQTKSSRQTCFQVLKRNVSKGKTEILEEGDYPCSLFNVKSEGVNGMQSKRVIAANFNIPE